MICATDGELPPEPAADEAADGSAAGALDWAAEVAGWVVDSAVVVDDEQAASSSAARAPTATTAARLFRWRCEVI